MVKVENERPWAVAVKQEKHGAVSVLPAMMPSDSSRPPWKAWATTPQALSLKPRKGPRQKQAPASIETVKRARKRARLTDDAEPPPVASWEREIGDPASQDGRLISLRNYAAVDSEHGRYGLIDRGVQETGVQTLVMHVPKRTEESCDALDDVRPGSVLRVSSTLSGGLSGSLRVRFTTPARYYSPGTRITTLCIGVDAADWQDLMP